MCRAWSFLAARALRVNNARKRFASGTSPDVFSKVADNLLSSESETDMVIKRERVKDGVQKPTKVEGARESSWRRKAW
jgi:hypothetical protein